MTFEDDWMKIMNYRGSIPWLEVAASVDPTVGLFTDSNVQLLLSEMFSVLHRNAELWEKYFPANVNSQ